jgi:membrane protein implicated in regulation of membrane protease activity
MMHWISLTLRELLGLFVEDTRFVLTILGWLTVFALLLPQVPLPPPWQGALLFTGLAVILLLHCLRRVVRSAGSTPRDTTP